MDSERGVLCRLIRRLASEDTSVHLSGISCIPHGRLPFDPSMERTASTCEARGGDAFPSSGQFCRDDGNLFGLRRCIFKRENFPDDWLKMNGNISNATHRLSCNLNGGECSPSSVFIPLRASGRKSILRSRRIQHRSSNKLKPFSSENYLVLWLHNDNFCIQDHVCGTLIASTTEISRQYVAADESDISSNSSYFASVMPQHNRSCKEKARLKFRQPECVSGLSALPKFQKLKQKSLDSHDVILASFYSLGICKATSFREILERKILFYLGISVGVMKTMQSRKKEVENLNKLLKDTENLVHDLHEELEMKSSLTVKELADEACECDEPLSKCANPEESIDSVQYHLQKLNFLSQEPDTFGQGLFLKDAHESMSFSRIEAELEAELEKLELSMSTDGVGELDPDFMSKVVHGELRGDIFGEGTGGSEAEAHGDSSSNSITQIHDENYSVSPSELSLRLHGVIQCRLEQRIHKLDTALHEIRVELKALEAARPNLQLSCSNSHVSCVSYEAGPETVELE